MQDWRLTAILSNNSVSQLKLSSNIALYSFPRNTIFILSCSEYGGRKGLPIEFVTLPFFSVLCQAYLILYFMHVGLTFRLCPKLYIPGTINICKKVLTKAIWADKKWAGFWQISLYIK